MGITIPVYLHFVSFIRSFFRTFSSRRIMKNLKTCVFSAIVILVISFGDEAESKPMEEGEISSKEAMEIDRRREKDAEASPEEGTSLKRLKRQESGCLDQPDWECIPGPPLRALTEEGTSLKRLKRLSSDQGTEEDKKLLEYREAGWFDKIKNTLKRLLGKIFKKSWFQKYKSILKEKFGSKKAKKVAAKILKKLGEAGFEALGTAGLEDLLASGDYDNVDAENWL